jgi:cytochrome c556
MSLNRITSFAFAGLIAAGIAAGGIAQDAVLSPEEAIEARQATMRSNAGVMGGAAALTGAEAVAAAETLIENFTKLPTLFPEGSTAENSRALPVIWENFDEFTGYFATGLEAATAMKAAAEAGDAAAYAESTAAIGGLCGQCHSKFRAS